jgi:hypothetical protein
MLDPSLDVTPPNIISTSPSSGQNSVDINDPIVITFDEEMNTGSVE